MLFMLKAPLFLLEMALWDLVGESLQNMVVLPKQPQRDISLTKMVYCMSAQTVISLAGYSPWGHKESDTTEQLTLLLSMVYLVAVIKLSK